MSCGVSLRRSSDLLWLWLWCRLAATALIRPLAWELPYATGAALKKTKRPKKKKKKKKGILAQVTPEQQGGAFNPICSIHLMTLRNDVQYKD